MMCVGRFKSPSQWRLLIYMVFAYTDRLSSFYVLYKTSKEDIPDPGSGFRPWTESWMSFKILLSRGNSNNTTHSGPLSFRNHSKRRR